MVRGSLRLIFKRDLAGAQADFDKVLALNSGDSGVQLGYSRLMIALGRLPEAIAATRKAIELDPLSTSGWAQLGRLLAASGQFAPAREALNRSLEISPESNYAHFHLGETDLLEGNVQDALAEFRKAGVWSGRRGHGPAHAWPCQRIGPVAG